MKRIVFMLAWVMIATNVLASDFKALLKQARQGDPAAQNAVGVIFATGVDSLEATRKTNGVTVVRNLGRRPVGFMQRRHKVTLKLRLIWVVCTSRVMGSHGMSRPH